MCGRFVLFSSSDEIRKTFSIDSIRAKVAPDYNVCPTRHILTIINENGQNVLVAMHWGLVPSWAKDRSMAARMINARSETLSEKPGFRNAFKKRRCLIPANGYYEWKGERGNRQPWYITTETGTPFAFAGLWERWIDRNSPDHSPLDSCTIVTTEAIASIRHIHDRMPALPAPEDYQSWLDPGLEDAAELNRMLRTGAIEQIRSHPVSKIVNSVRSNGPELIQKIDA